VVEVVVGEVETFYYKSRENLKLWVFSGGTFLSF
jgi:hypothetical protein